MTQTGRLQKTKLVMIKLAALELEPGMLVKAYNSSYSGD
jgi:hypothetical protein